MCSLVSVPCHLWLMFLAEEQGENRQLLCSLHVQAATEKTGTRKLDFQLLAGLFRLGGGGRSDVVLAFWTTQKTQKNCAHKITDYTYSFTTTNPNDQQLFKHVGFLYAKLEKLYFYGNIFFN